MAVSRNITPILMAMILALGLAGCAGSSRYQETSEIDTMGTGFGHTDINLIVDDIVSDLLQSPFIGRYEQPVRISVLHIANKTSDLIDTDALVGDKLMMAIIKSGGVFEFVDRQMLDETVREAELAANGLVDQNEATRLGRAAGVQLLMYGELSSIRKANRDTDQRFYRMSLKLVDTERNTIVWADDKEFVKVADKGASQW